MTQTIRESASSYGYPDSGVSVTSVALKIALTELGKIPTSFVSVDLMFKIFFCCCSFCSIIVHAL